MAAIGSSAHAFGLGSSWGKGDSQRELLVLQGGSCRGGVHRAGADAPAILAVGGVACLTSWVGACSAILNQAWLRIETALLAVAFWSTEVARLATATECRMAASPPAVAVGQGRTRSTELRSPSSATRKARSLRRTPYRPSSPTATTPRNRRETMLSDRELVCTLPIEAIVRRIGRGRRALGAKSALASSDHSLSRGSLIGNR